MFSINTDIASENVMRIMDKISRNQAKTMERLTSGYAINRASDNAAGLSVVTNMTSQIRGYNIAMNNANDGINLLQTADGALGDTTSLLQRMRELGIQSMNGTYTSAQRADMNEELQNLNREITRTAQVTKFNNQRVFGASYQLQVGWETGAANKLTMTAFSLASVAGDVLTAGNASTMVGLISSRLGSIQTQRARWGALVNRLESAVSNMNNMQVNTTASRSRLWDTDYAKEAANLAKNQILQQAAIAMMSIANQNKQGLLALIR
jgi:flagellin